MGRELRSSLSENAQLLDELDEAVNDETPQLFKDFMDASDEERSMLEVRSLACCVDVLDTKADRIPCRRNSS